MDNEYYNNEFFNLGWNGGVQSALIYVKNAGAEIEQMTDYSISTNLQSALGAIEDAVFNINKLYRNDCS
jgi:hypothetical protein